ncbi:MAG TPA: hypothetical protein PLD68_06695 [Clostridiales bacterium]|nr:hypothetical protein [Clostridiales bacterium]
MKHFKRLLSLSLAFLLVATCTGLAFAPQKALPVESPASSAAAPPAPAAEKTAQPSARPAAPVDTAAPESEGGAAIQSAGTETVADEVLRENSGRNRVREVIDSIVSQFKGVKVVGGDTEGLKTALNKVLVQSLGAVTDNLIKTILKVFPARDYTDFDDYVTENFLEGTPVYQTASAPGAHWNVGYKSVSIVPDDLLERPYYTAGYFNNYDGSKPITGILDDQCFRAVCINDGSGNGTAVFVSLDGFALTNTNVRILRERLADFIQANNIVSLDVTTTHSHYCIDTSGLGVSLLPYVVKNIEYKLLGKEDQLTPTDPEFMEILFSRGAQAVKDAYKAMQPGSLYYCATDISDMIGDKQTPIVFDPNVNTIRFVPDNESANEIWMVNAGIHPVSYDRNTTLVSSEYPYAIVRYAKELAGADVAFYQGAQEEISRSGEVEVPPGASDFDRVQAFGKKIVQRILQPDSEILLEPYLNVTHAEIFLPIDNPILQAAAKLNLINSRCVDTTGRFEDVLMITELGYCEFGSGLSIAMVPGEMAPEIAFGGAKTAAESWNGTEWTYPPMQELTGKKLIVFGLTDDEIGYIIPDNDFATTLADTFGGMLGENVFGERNSHYAEMLSLSPKTGSIIMRYYMAMIEDYVS